MKKIDHVIVHCPEHISGACWRVDEIREHKCGDRIRRKIAYFVSESEAVTFTKWREQTYSAK